MDATVLKEKIISDFTNFLCQVRKGYKPNYEILLEEISFVDLIQNNDLDENFSLTVLQYYSNNNMSPSILFPQQQGGSCSNTRVLTQQEYDNLDAKSDGVIYSIISGGKITKVYTGEHEWDICKLWGDEISSFGTNMYIGYITNYDIKSFSEITFDMILEAVEAGTMHQVDVQQLGKVSIGKVPEYSYIVIAVPEQSGLTSKKDNGFGMQVEFDESLSGANGNVIIYPGIEYGNYKLFGELASVGGERFIYVN